MSPKVLLVISVLAIILAGSGVGLLLSRKVGPSVAGAEVDSQMIRTDKEVGSTDTKTFRDSAQGTLEKGGLGNEGTHNLVRVGGVSQTVYLTSSVVDLDEFAGKKVEVWGETIKGQKAGWLMDVGRVKLIE